MTASSSVVLANLAYLIGAIVLAALGGTAVWLRHRKPKSVDANVASFNRGLRALAPEGDADPSQRQDYTSPRVRPRASGVAVIRSSPDPARIDLGSPVDVTDDAVEEQEAGAGEASGQRAGADSG